MNLIIQKSIQDVFLFIQVYLLKNIIYYPFTKHACLYLQTGMFFLINTLLFAYGHDGKGVCER